jgi:hypothetical protein
MVMGLIMPFVGPAVDHHYVDRSPAHAHAFVGEDTNLHEHLLTSFEHDHSLADANGDGVSLATSSASSAHGPLTLDGATLESSIPNYSDHMIAMHLGEPRAPDTEEIDPLDRPPRLG